MACTTCKNPDASKICLGCYTAPLSAGESQELRVRYCNYSCQRVDWDDHNVTCMRLNDRIILYCVADTARKLYTISRELSWRGTKISSAKKEGHRLILRGRYNPHAGNDELDVFPSELFSTKQDRDAALVFSGGRDASLWMVEFLKDMLHEIVVDIKEVQYLSKNDKLAVSFIQTVGYTLSSSSEAFPILLGPFKLHDSHNDRHQILKITTRWNETFAIDIAGAKHGSSDTVMQWDEFERSRISGPVAYNSAPQAMGILQTEDYSVERILHLNNDAYKPKATREGWNGEDNLRLMNICMLEWQKGAEISLKDLWKLEEDEFKAKQSDLVDFIEWQFSNGHDGDDPRSTVKGKRLAGEIKRMWPFWKLLTLSDIRRGTVAMNASS